VKSRFQKLPFKFNLQRYSEGEAGSSGDGGAAEEETGGLTAASSSQSLTDSAYDALHQLTPAGMYQSNAVDPSLTHELESAWFW
jgi:hypothetical protein